MLVCRNHIVPLLFTARFRLWCKRYYWAGSEVEHSFFNSIRASRLSAQFAVRMEPHKHVGDSRYCVDKNTSGMLLQDMGFQPVFRKRRPMLPVSVQSLPIPLAKKN